MTLPFPVNASFSPGSLVSGCVLNNSNIGIVIACVSNKQFFNKTHFVKKWRYFVLWSENVNRIVWIDENAVVKII